MTRSSTTRRGHTSPSLATNVKVFALLNQLNITQLPAVKRQNRGQRGLAGKSVYRAAYLYVEHDSSFALLEFNMSVAKSYSITRVDNGFLIDWETEEAAGPDEDELPGSVLHQRCYYTKQELFDFLEGELGDDPEA